ncbi:hypothetical protein CEP53_004220 [Fusarium sp. AF-6]|nr:hypothetical protein CEP53_004220 [Fusarium sp. AF-6]
MTPASLQAPNPRHASRVAGHVVIHYLFWQERVLVAHALGPVASLTCHPRTLSSLFNLVFYFTGGLRFEGSS